MSMTDPKPENPERPPRLGPRPLPLYLTTAMLNWSGSRLASESLRNGLPLLNPGLATLQRDLEHEEARNYLEKVWTRKDKYY